MSILTVNCGSSSLKVDLVEFEEHGRATPIATAHSEAAESGWRVDLRLGQSEAAGLELPAANQPDAVRETIVRLREQGLLDRLTAVGHRVVHGGPRLIRPVLISDATLNEIRAATDLAPLHNAPALEAIEIARNTSPGVPQVATFDTAFFHDLPLVAATYAVPAQVARGLGIRRYGFHGLAHRYMSERFSMLTGHAGARLVTLQLGSGCSATALKDGRPLDTSMGFTPLEGLVMATRPGDLDPSIPLYLAARPGRSLDSIESMLNRESGLAGLAGGEKDMRRLLEREAAGDHDAALAVEVFCYRVRKYIGAYAAVLGGLDGLVFGGGIGENSPAIRKRICSGFEWLGMAIDDDANAAGPSDRRISPPGSNVDVRVVRVEESSVIAADTVACLSGLKVGGGYGHQ